MIQSGEHTEFDFTALRAESGAGAVRLDESSSDDTRADHLISELTQYSKYYSDALYFDGIKKLVDELRARLANIAQSSESEHRRLLMTLRHPSIYRALKRSEVPHEHLIAGFLSAATAVETEKALDFAFRRLGKWRDSHDVVSFSTLFGQILAKLDSERLIPLTLAAVTESYLLKRSLPQREPFKVKAQDKIAEMLGPERAEAIFSRLG